MSIRLSLVLLGLLMLSACAGGPPPDPIVVQLAALDKEEKQRLYDGRYSSPPVLDINRKLSEEQSHWDSDDLTWIETDAGWHARLRFISPTAKGLKLGICVDPSDFPMIFSVEESDGTVAVAAEKVGVTCNNSYVFHLPLIKGEVTTLRMSAPPNPHPPEFELQILRFQHRGN